MFCSFLIFAQFIVFLVVRFRTEPAHKSEVNWRTDGVCKLFTQTDESSNNGRCDRRPPQRIQDRRMEALLFLGLKKEKIVQLWQSSAPPSLGFPAGWCRNGSSSCKVSLWEEDEGVGCQRWRLAVLILSEWKRVTLILQSTTWRKSCFVFYHLKTVHMTSEHRYLPARLFLSWIIQPLIKHEQTTEQKMTWILCTDYSFISVF